LRKQQWTADSQVGVSVFIGIQTNNIYCLVGGGENTSGGDISDLNWHMATLVVTAGTGRLYLDGTLVGSPFVVGGNQNMVADWLIGSSRYSNNTDDSYPWKGLLDEPTFWNAAFTAGQVAELYNSGTPIDPTTHSQQSNLLHWYRFGDDVSNDIIPALKDQIGSADGTMRNTAGIKLTKQSVTFTPLSLNTLPEDNGCDLHFNATSYGGSGNWAADLGGWSGVLLGSNLPVRRQTSAFPGNYEIANTSGSIMYRLINSISHLITTSTTASYVMRINSGDENGSGGFYLGYDAEAVNSDFQMYNLFYAEDAAARIRRSNGSENYLAGEEHVSAHPNKYITVHAVIDMPNTTIKVYVNGGLIATDSSPDGAFSAGASAPLGIFGTAKVSFVGGDASSATNQSIMEVARYQKILTANEIARQTAEFNALKGWV
jgi:hypothetical protein